MGKIHVNNQYGKFLHVNYYLILSVLLICFNFFFYFLLLIYLFSIKKYNKLIKQYKCKIIKLKKMYVFLQRTTNVIVKLNKNILFKLKTIIVK